MAFGPRTCFWPTPKALAVVGVESCSCDESLALRRILVAIEKVAQAGRTGGEYEDARLALFEVGRLCRTAKVTL